MGRSDDDIVDSGNQLDVPLLRAWTEKRYVKFGKLVMGNIQKNRIFSRNN